MLADQGQSRASRLMSILHRLFPLQPASSPAGEPLRPVPSRVDDRAPPPEELMKADLLNVRPHTWGLFGKYVVSFVGLVVFVLAVNGALEMYITYRDTTETVGAQQTQRAEQIGD